MKRLLGLIPTLAELEDFAFDRDDIFTETSFLSTFNQNLVLPIFSPLNIPFPTPDIVGTGNNDVIINSGTVLEILSLGGDDTITNTATGVVTTNIDASGGDDTIINEGIISGGILDISGYDTIINDGVVGFIDAGRQDDRVFLLDNSSVAGSLNGGTGHDTLSFQGRTSGIAFATGDLNEISFEIYFGTNFNDTLTNTIAVENILGAGGDDIIVNEGTVTSRIFGNSGADEITNTVTASVLITNGGGGADTITNYGTSLSINGGSGNDTLINHGANNNITGGDGDDTLTNYGTNNNIITGRDGHINGGDGDDIITNTPISEDGQFIGVIWGGNDSDVITNSGAVRELGGGNGSRPEDDDPFLVGLVDPVRDGDDIITNSGHVTQSVFGNDGDDIITNTSSGTIDQSIFGGEGDDTIINAGTIGADIDASDGDDIVNLQSGSVAGHIDGGSGTDTLSFAGQINGVDISLDDLNISSFEIITGTSQNDIITGNNADNVINGGAGDDILRGNVEDVVLQDIFTAFGEVEEVIVDGVSGTDVELINFTVAVDGIVTIDILSSDFDIDGDGIISTLGSEITVYSFNSFRLNNLGVFQGFNEFAEPGTGDEDGSTDRTDSFLSLNLAAGDYVLAVADFFTLQADVRNGFSPGNQLFNDGDGDFQVIFTGASFVEGGIARAADSDTLNGGDGDDTLFGLNGDDSLFGDAGEDVLHGGTGDDILHGGSESDFLYGNSGDDFLGGDAGDDFLLGGEGNDRLSGGDGENRLFGEAGDDLLVGGSGLDRLQGGDGNDILRGGDGNDRLLAQSGNDTLLGEAGNDLLRGGDGVDVLRGGDGNDVLTGEAGNDRLFGDIGDDILFGGEGRDTLTGGSGADTFDYTLGSGADIVTDFESGTDVISVDAALDVFAFADLEIIQRNNNTLIRLEPGSDDSLLLLNTVATSLTADDFVFEGAPTPTAVLNEMADFDLSTAPDISKAADLYSDVFDRDIIEALYEDTYEGFDVFV